MIAILAFVFAAADAAKPELVKVSMSPTVVVAQPSLAGTVSSASYDKPLWQSPLAIADSARLQAGVDATAGGLRRHFDSSDLLWRSEIEGGQLGGEILKGALYCGTRYYRNAWDPSELLDLLFRRNTWTRWDPRLCLLDENNDGTFDHVVAVGRVKVGPVKIEISPVRYDRKIDEPVPNATLQVRLTKGTLIQGRLIMVDGFFGDQQLNSVGIHLYPQVGAKFVGYPNQRSAASSVYPKGLKFGDLSVTVLAYDPAKPAVTARFDNPFYRSPVFFEPKGELIIPIVR